MTVELVGKSIRSAEAGEAMTDKKHYIVQLDATGKIEVAEGATDLIVGVLQDNCAAGEPATYAFGGTVKVKAGGSIAIGAFVTSDGNGKAVSTTTDGDVVIGRYVGTAAAADGDLIEVQMGIHRFFIA
jgi:hypothetical protein